jgi:hypothetical protein
LPHFFWLKSGQYLDVHSIYTALETRHFTISKEHLLKSMTAGDRQDWQTALAELHLFLETLVDALRERAEGEELVVPIVEGFEWTSLRELRSGLSTAEDDWRFQWRITLLLAELLLKRFEQLQDLEPE